MSDLISRKKLKEIIEPMVGIFEDDGSFWWSRESILGAIDSEFVEAEPKVGKWVEHPNHIECPYCKVWFLKDYMPRNSYCPNCGSKLERSE